MLESNSAFEMRLEINLDQIARLSEPTVLMQYRSTGNLINADCIH